MKPIEPVKRECRRWGRWVMWYRQCKNMRYGLKRLRKQPRKNARQIKFNEGYIRTLRREMRLEVAARMQGAAL